MKVYHVEVRVENGWYVVQALEDPAVFTQAKTLDEVIENVREVALLLHNEKDVQVELIVLPGVGMALKQKGARRRGGGSVQGVA